ncbi:DNase I-like protein [Tothia fuscella]|uniref:DNase I-like protein n=1 Tax=Tothia fuscella TaxID=1048955 RepID=A0A9P4NYQ2_9PEZI|nr:DNase I-like protein [Tothia fuscella]
MAAPLEIYFLTFNCARTLIDTNLFAAHFFQALPKGSRTLPDVIAISLQEVAPIAYSFLGGSYITPYLQRFDDAVQIAARSRLGQEHGDKQPYERLLTNAVGMTVGMVFVKRAIRERVRWIEAAGVGVGLWEMGNKGAVGIRIALDETELTFIAAHLAPMEGAVLRRNTDWQNIVRGLVFEQVDANNSKPNSRSIASGGESEPLLSRSLRQESGLYKPKTTIIFGGDLNYRTSHTRPRPDTHKTFPKPSERHIDNSTPEGRLSISQLWEKDQLNQERMVGRTVHGFTEMPVTFPPTYKYITEDMGNGSQVVPKTANAEVLDDELLSEGQSWQWAKHRWPSWCDRILYISAHEMDPRVYTSLPLHKSSDHRAVALSATIHAGNSAGSQGDVDILDHPPFPLNPNWKADRAAARRREVIVGFASYLTLTNEGNFILLGIIGGIVF